jgi:hypothetical protein
LKGLVREVRVDHYIHREYTKGIEAKLVQSHGKVIKWLEAKDVAMDGLKVRLDAQEKEMEELRNRLAGAERFIESFMNSAPPGKIFIFIADCRD